jgi:hypothetical protein
VLVGCGLFFGGLWSLYNDFSAAFWNWDYIEIFFLELFLGYAWFSHAIFFVHSRTSLFYGLFALMNIRIFRLSVVASTHHLSFNSHSVEILIPGLHYFNAESFDNDTGMPPYVLTDFS